MRIKKIYQVVAAPAKVVNEYSESTKDAYSADYINDELAKNIIEATASGYVTTGENTNDKISLLSSYNLGNKLSMSNGGIKIGAGVSYIKVSASITFSTVSGTTSRHHLICLKNSSSFIDEISRFSGNWETISSKTYLLSVQENDIIYLYTRTQDSNGSIVDSANITVEVVE